MSDLYMGTLQGYRHFTVITDRVSSISYSGHDWRDDENAARCIKYGETLTVDQAEQKARRLELELTDTFTTMLHLEPLEASDSLYDQYLFSHYQAKSADQMRRLDRTCRFLTPHTMRGCRCGFYVSYDPAVNFYAHRIWHPVSSAPSLQGVVEAWGTVILGTRGVRASRLRIKALAPVRRPDSKTEPPVMKTAESVVRLQLPSVEWYDDAEDMIAEWPEPDRSGLPVEIDREIGSMLQASHYGK